MFTFNAPEGLSASVYTISGGRNGIMQTVQLMRGIVDEYKKNPYMRFIAFGLIDSLPQKDYAGEIEACFNYVRDQIRYVQDIYDVETLQTPDKTIELGQGDCDDKSTLLATLLECIGFKTTFKLAGYNGPDFEHVYVYVQGPDIAMHLDATEPDPAGYEPPGATVEMYVD